MRAFYQGPNVCIEISDDGAGINSSKVLSKAREKGLVTKDKELSEKETFELLFQPGFSTASAVSAISGRGVGLDVVRQKISSIRGEVKVDSAPGQGTTFMLKLPLTLSIIDGLLVDVAGERFILPLEFVSKIVVMQREEIQQVYKGLVTVDEQKIPFFNLRREFNCQGEIPGHSEVILVNYAGKLVGLAVDSVIGEYQVVIKPLGRVFHDLNMFSGAAILGDGGLALVLDLHRMISEFSGIPGVVIA
jgi:two-component system, chemotaxis family, sensor kinase CheA